MESIKYPSKEDQLAYDNMSPEEKAKAEELWGKCTQKDIDGYEEEARISIESVKALGSLTPPEFKENLKQERKWQKQFGEE
jgi:hypothetical protein